MDKLQMEPVSEDTQERYSDMQQIPYNELEAKGIALGDLDAIAEEYPDGGIRIDMDFFDDPNVDEKSKAVIWGMVERGAAYYVDEKETVWKAKNAEDEQNKKKKEEKKKANPRKRYEQKKK
jgi:hypothetical protein